MTSHLRHLLLAFGLLVLATPLRADANGTFYCDWSANYQQPDLIIFKVHPAMASLMQHSDGSIWSTSELIHEVEFALQKIMDVAPRELVLKYGGLEPYNTSYFTNPAPGTVAIRPRDPSEGCGNDAHERTKKKGSIIHLSTLATCNTWNHWDGQVADSTTFSRVLTHEIMHTLGFLHPRDCLTPVPTCVDSPTDTTASCSVLHGANFGQAALEYTDQVALDSEYGPSYYHGKYRRESADANNWWTLAYSALDIRLPESDWSQGSSLLPLSVIDSNKKPHLYRWQQSGDTVIDWGSPYGFGAQISAAGVAVSYGKRYLSFLFGQTETSVKKQLRTSFQTNSSNGTTMNNIEWAGDIGHDVTWDLRNSRLIHAWRTEEHEIVLGVSSGISGAMQYVFSPSQYPFYQASAPPSISCGPSSIDFNCMMVWAGNGEGGEHQRYMHYVQFKLFWNGGLASWEFDFGNQYSLSYYQYGSPKVTFHDGFSVDSFVVAWKTPGECFYTLNKGTGTTAPLGGLDGHCANSSTSYSYPLDDIVLGSTSGPRAEAWATIRDILLGSWY